MKTLAAIAFFAFAFFASGSAEAAKFKPLTSSKLESSALKNLAAVAKRIINDESAFGDAGRVAAYSITRGDGEANLNTMKQLNRRLGGLNSDDSSGVSMQGESARELAAYLLEAFSQSEEEDKMDKAKDELEAAIAAVKRERGLEIFGTNHADEDGSWQILSILDSNNEEALFIRIGYFGT